MDFDFTNKVAIATGAASGMAELYLKNLAELGAVAMFLLALLGGIGLNLTHCILPMIPIYLLTKISVMLFSLILQRKQFTKSVRNLILRGQHLIHTVQDRASAEIISTVT